MGLKHAGVAFALAASLLAAAMPATAAAEACFARAARLAGVETDLLLAMSFVESRWRPDTVNGANSNGTEDVCLMQINAIHYPRLAAIGITRERLLSDWCVCLLAGAQVLREMRDAVGASSALAPTPGAPSRPTMPARSIFRPDGPTPARCGRPWRRFAPCGRDTPPRCHRSRSSPATPDWTRWPGNSARAEGRMTDGPARSHHRPPTGGRRPWGKPSGPPKP